MEGTLARMRQGAPRDTAQTTGLLAEAPRPGETVLVAGFRDRIELKPGFERFQTVV